MSIRGLVSHLAEPEPGKQCIVTDAWCRDILALAPAGKPPPVRVRIYAASDNSFPTAVYRRALDVYAAHNIPVVGVVAIDFDAVALNEPLGLGGEPTLNAAIQEFTLRLEGVCRQLVPHGMKALWVLNEPNLSDQPPIGAEPPRVKPGALNPTVFGSLLYQASKRARAAGIQRIYAGALSCLEQFHTNPAGDWVGGYIDAALSYLASHGKDDLQLDVLSLNMEGWVDLPYAQKAADALHAVAAKYGQHITTAIGEWGWATPANGVIDASRAASTFAALDACFDEIYFFSHPLREPHVPTSFGARDWTMVPLQDGSGLLGFVPFGQPEPWYDVLVNLLK